MDKIQRIKENIVFYNWIEKPDGKRVFFILVPSDVFTLYGKLDMGIAQRTKSFLSNFVENVRVVLFRDGYWSSS